MTADITTTSDTDTMKKVLIIGAGPAGSTAAIRLLGLGIQPVIVEREDFPRYHIGESMTGEVGGLLREMGLGDKMTAAGHPIKHGVNVFGTRGGKDWFIPVMQRTKENKLNEVFTWQVRRSEFDKMMLDEAVSRGAEVLSGRAVAPLMSEDGKKVVGARIRLDDGTTVEIDADMVFDCSGQASFLANNKVTGPKYLGSYSKQVAVFSQVHNYAHEDTTEAREDQPGNTHIFYKSKYHWAWAIPVDDKTTSIGIVVPVDYFKAQNESKEDFIRREIGELNPALAERVPTPVVLVEEPRAIPNYSFQVRKFAGPGYICIGDSHRFVDPIFSFGLYIAMKEAGIAADAAAKWLAEGDVADDDDKRYHDYMAYVEGGIDILEDLVDTFWENPLAFSVLVHSRYFEGVIDMFAGRIYDGDGLPTDERHEAISVMRKLLKRERTYDDEGLYSVPIGSRYQEEQPLWEADLDAVEVSDKWMRELV